MAEPMIITGGTIIDGAADTPLRDRAIMVEAGRIKAIDSIQNLPLNDGHERVDASGKFIIPGLMNANVHLMLGACLPANLLRYQGCYEEVVTEAAQIALKNGLTTVFDTMGQRKPLQNVRERINRGEIVGSRFYCAGWIVGLDGLFSRDFMPKAAEVFTSTIVEEVNAACAENVGPALTWMPPEQVAQEVQKYIESGIDFVKYASSEHRSGDPTTSLLFSSHSQAAIVETAHRAGLTAQAHTTSLESLRAAIEAGCDIVQHCNFTGPYLIPDDTLEQIARRGTGAVLFPFTRKRFQWIMENCEGDRVNKAAANRNCERLLQAGALILLANDGAVWGDDLKHEPMFQKSWFAPGDDDLSALADGHFVWLDAMEEMGMRPVDMLRAATINVAKAYQVDADLGSLEVGKIADMVILDRDPLASSDNYRSISTVIKEGAVIDRARLPLKRVITSPTLPPSDEVLAYRAHRHVGRSAFPSCPLCN